MNVSGTFAHLTDNIPDWIVRLDDLSSRIASRQIELAQLAAKHEAENNRKPPEVEGLQALHDDQQRRRKRKTASISSAVSGAPRYRTRSMVVVWYDSQVQDTFEALVRNIGTARNNVRKAKMSARLKNWGTFTGNEEDSEVVRSRFMLPRASARSTGEKTIHDLIDAGLEVAQSQCETGAHQFLRDGDCKKEVEAAKKKLEEVRLMAEQELEKQKEEERRQQEEEAKREEAKRKESPGDEGIEVDDEEGEGAEEGDDAEYSLPLEWKARYARA